MNKEIIKRIQLELSKQTPIKLVPDGIAGEQTLDALLYIDQIPNTWPKQRQLVGYIQYLCATEGINAGPIDGFWGPQTEYGYERFKEANKHHTWRTDEGEGIGSVIGGFVGNLFGEHIENDWPIQTQEELKKYYGEVGKNQTSVTLPYPFRIAWNKTQKVKKITCHKKTADSFVRIMERVKDHYGNEIKSLGLDLWGGCLNVRKMRGGDKWSTHAWGIGHDFDPERNKLRWNSTQANFAKPEYKEWWKIWESEGWVSLGREKNYDWMHIQAAKIRKK